MKETITISPQLGLNETFNKLLNELLQANTQKRTVRKGFFKKVAPFLQNKGISSIKRSELFENLGVYHYLVNSDYKEAIVWMKKALQIVAKAGLCQKEIKLHKFIGINSYLLGDLEKAIESYFEAVKVIDRSKENFDREKAAVYNNISIVFNKPEETEIRKYYINEALELYKKIDSAHGKAMCYINLGNIASNVSDFDQALVYYNKARGLTLVPADLNLEASMLNNIGYALFSQNNFEEALIYVLEALELKKELGDPHSIIITEITLAEIYLASDNFDKGISILEDALVKAKKIEAGIEITKAYEILAKGYASKGLFEKAYKALYQMGLLKDKLFTNEKQRNLLEISQQFRAEITEREAKFYKKKERQLQQYAKKLEESNKELKMFAQLSAHDIKEPIRMININLGFLKQSLKTKLKEEEVQLLNFAYKSSTKLSHIIDDVLKLTKVDGSAAVMEEVNLNQVLTEIENHIQPTLFQRNAKIVYNELPSILADESQLYLLLENLIANAIKYNRSEQPEVHVDYKSLKSKHQFKVSDNGIGMSPSFHSKAFDVFSRRNETKNEFEGTGIGLAICKRIVERHKGSIAITQPKLGGTSFTFTLKKF